jgi:uncharacterized membrane protein YbhN (UPF0104 family)
LRWAQASIAYVLAAIFLAWTLAAVDLVAVAALLKSANLPMLLLVQIPALVLLFWLLRGLRWHLVLAALGAEPSFVSSYFSTAVSLGLAAVTPMQSGELLKLAHARDRHGLSIAAGTAGFAVERLADVIVLLALSGAASLALLLPSVGLAMTAVGLAVASVTAAAVLVFLGRRVAPGMVDELARGARILLARPGLQIAVWTLTVGCWILCALIWHTSLHAVGIDTSIAQSTFLVGVVTLAGVALMVPGAVGVAEATVAAVLVQQGFAEEQAVTGALALRSISLVLVALGAVHWWLTRTAPWTGR